MLVKAHLKHTFHVDWFKMVTNRLNLKRNRGEIYVANLKAPLQMVCVWVANKSEKNVLEAKG